MRLLVDENVRSEVAQFLSTLGDITIDALSNLFATHDEYALDGRLVILTAEGFIIAPTPDDVQ